MSTLAFLEGPDLFIVAAVVLLLFGGSQLPKLAKSIGQARREFEKAIHDEPEPSKDTPSPVEPAVTPVLEAPASPTTTGEATDDQVVLSRAEFDALLKAKDDAARQHQGSDQAP